MKRNKIFLIIESFMIPTLLVPFVISFHSTLLVKSWMQLVILLLLIIFVSAIIHNIQALSRNKVKVDKKDKKKTRFIFPVLLILYILGCFTSLFILYGPYEGFRTWLITTAMGTMRHQKYAEWFYSDAEIARVLSDNTVIESGESTDDTPFDNPFPTVFANEYEEQLFKDLREDEVYRVIKFKVNGQNAFLAAIYDPSRINVEVTNNYPKNGQYVVKMAEIHNALIAINGGGFVDVNHSSTGGMPGGVTISNEKVFTGQGKRNRVIGFNKNNKLVLLSGTTAEEAVAKGVRDSVTHQPFLIVNGKRSFIKGKGGWGYAARTAIGQREDGVVLLLVVDSNKTRTSGADMIDLTDIMENYGAINAANLDGGTSSVIAEKGVMLNNPVDGKLRNKTRPVATFFIVK